jgi:hypothetical protein
MIHVLVCSLLLVMSTGCASSLFAQGERMPGTITSTESVAVSRGMAPLIRTTRGAGLVVGVRVPFDLGRAPASEDQVAGESSPLLSMLAGAGLGSFVSLQRAAQPKMLATYRLPTRASL